MRGLRRDSGQSVLELAIAMPVLLALLVGIFEFGIAWNRKQVLTNAAREAARFAVLPRPKTEDDVQAVVDDYLNSAAIPTSEVTATYVNYDAGTNETVTVTLTMNHELTFVGPIMGFMGGSVPGAVTLSSTVNMRHE